MTGQGVTRHARASLGLLLLLTLTGVALAGCAIPTWVPLIGSSKPLAPGAMATPPSRQATAPLISATPAAGSVVDPDNVVDRVICVVNNDAITLFELDEAEAYYLYETKEPAPTGEARTTLRDRLIQRIIENRLQLQQAEREKITAEDSEIAEQLADIMKRMNAKTDVELEQALRVQGVTAESVKKRIRDQIMVDRIRRRRVNLRVTVTEQEIDRYLDQNREKLETGLTFEARHILFLPDADRGEDGWVEARRRATDAYERVLGAETSTSSPRSCRRTAPARAAARWARSSAASWRRRSRAPFSAFRGARRQRRSARRSGTTSSAWTRRKRSWATASPRRATRSATSCCARSCRSGSASGWRRSGRGPSSTCGCDIPLRATRRR